MKHGNKVVFGIYKSRSSVEAAIERFKADGFRTDDISALMPQKTSGGEFHSSYSGGYYDSSYADTIGGVKTTSANDIKAVKASKAPEGATVGAPTGAILGGALGWLIGAGALAVTGLGPLIAAGPLLGMLAGAGVGGAVGTLAGGLIGMGIPEYEAKRFETQIKDGGILLSVHADDSDWATKAKNLMEATGALDISSTTEAEGDFANNRKTTDRRADMKA